MSDVRDPLEPAADKSQNAINRRSVLRAGRLRLSVSRSQAVAGLDDVAVMGQAVEQCGSPLCLAEHARLFVEGYIGSGDDGGGLIKPADRVEQKLAAGLGKGPISEVVQDNEVHAG